MAKRRTWNNVLILALSLFGMLMLYVSNLISPNSSSYPLLPEGAGIEALVMQELVVRRDGGHWRSVPAVDDAQLQALMAHWREARLLPVAEPVPAPMQPVQVDLYLDDGSAPITVLIYPRYGYLKLLGQPQWWKLLSAEGAQLLNREGKDA
ncbi:hypothetical protein SAMN04488540_11589 [Ferrimonas sediminum]|uniref:Uncharacterized protein n=1 Tax=Ferrimonas sediminum TaxID=718193 RepID=A0A1G8XMS0_9GAMM|nr:hypothetical protein [Ferrimonas sediminum]SDJ91848.1 hypothetical protein SAMN04488540_11589 [Ferrimonas sediminum]